MRARAAFTLTGLIVLGCPIFGAFGETLPPIYSGPVSDAVVSADGQSVYVAAYAHDEILQLNARDGASASVWRAGDGPSALALAEPWLVSLNRLDGTISVVRTDSATLAGTVLVGKGAHAIVPMGGARFAALDAFRQEVVLLDAATLSTVGHVDLGGRVPVDAAPLGDRLAVATRAPSQLLVLDATSGQTVSITDLPAEPKQCVRFGPNTVAVLTTAGLATVDAAGMLTGPAFAAPVDFLGADPRGILLLNAGRVRLFGQGGSSVDLAQVPVNAQRAAGAPGRVIAWSTRDGALWSLTSRSIPDTASASRESSGGPLPAIRPEADESAQAAAGAVKQTRPLTSEDGALRPSEPAAHMAQEPAGSTTPDEPQLVTPHTEAPSPSGQARPDDESAGEAAALPPRGSLPEREYRYTLKPGRVGLGGFRPYAPRFGDPTGRTFNRELAQAFAFTEESGSLALLDWNQKIRDVDFGGAIHRKPLDGGYREVIDGGVHFYVDHVEAQADEFIRITAPEELMLRGDVVLERRESSLTADSLRLFRPPPEPLPPDQRLVPARGERALRHPLVPRGYHPPKGPAEVARGVFEGTNILWQEPGRRLKADRLEVDPLHRTGDLENANGHAGPLYFGARRLRILGPADATGQDFWVTTCDLPVPHYRLRLSRAELEDNQRVAATNARLQIGRVNTPIYVPRVTTSFLAGKRRLSTELDLGSQAGTGPFVDVAQWFRVTDNINLAPRFYPTAQEGIGFGLDGEYDYMNDPASFWFRSRGYFHTLYTTEDRGYTEWYHRQELRPSTVVLAQWEQWYDRNFVKDFYNNVYENRTGPRTFLNVTDVHPQYITTATVAKSTHDFTRETEKLPEGTIHVMERRLGGRLYGTFDGAAGYYTTQPNTVDSGRLIAIGRLTYDMNLKQGLNVTPFVEADGTYYTKTLDPDGQGDSRATVTTGVTVQARAQRGFHGVRNFSGFKHIIVPSTTFLYRPNATLNADETPRFDDLDDRPGRTRIESTLDNVVLGKNASTGDVWPVARVTFFQGNDLTNETVKSNDYEVDAQVRPRPWWGLQGVGEIHNVESNPNVPGEDFNRVLTYLFYDNALGRNNFNGRLGFALTEAGDDILNQEILYGAGYKISGGWSFAFEHRYDVERNTLSRQTYAVRRRLHKWELGLRFRKRESGFDVGFEINLTDFREIGLGF